MNISDHAGISVFIATFFVVAFGLLGRCRAEAIADYVAGEDSTALVTPELQQAARQMLGAQADALLHGVELTMRKYDRDMSTQAGRRSWHGQLIREEIYTNELCKVEVYSNELTGAVWRYRLPFRPVTVSRVAGRVSYTTNGIPARLAAARARRAAAIETPVVTTNVEHTANTAPGVGQR